MFHFRKRAATLAAALMPAVGGAASLTLDQAVTLAVERSEAARAARADATGAREIARAAAQLPDPTLSVGIDNLTATGGDRFDPGADSMTMKRLGISQEWVSRAKREARQAAADAQAQRQAATADAAIAQARLQAALAYVDAFYSAQALALVELDEHHAHEELEAAKGRLAGAAGSGQEVLALAGAHGIVEDASAEARQAQADAALMLQRWIGIAPERLDAPTIAPAPGEADYVAAEPAVRAAQRELDVARAEASAVAAERDPDWTWQASWGQRQGRPDMVSFGVSIPLPVARAERQDRQVAARVARIETAQGRLEETRRAATADYRSLSSDAARLALRIERLADAAVRPARQRTEAALAGYRSNQGGLGGLFEARHAEVDVQRRLLSLQRDLARTRARLAYTPLVEGGQP